jgi:hypothetical protein
VDEALLSHKRRHAICEHLQRSLQGACNTINVAGGEILQSCCQPVYVGIGNTTEALAAEEQEVHSRRRCNSCKLTAGPANITLLHRNAQHESTPSMKAYQGADNLALL